MLQIDRSPAAIDELAVLRHRPERRGDNLLLLAGVTREFARLALGVLGVAQKVVDPAHRMSLSGAALFCSPIRRWLRRALQIVQGRLPL